MTPRLYLMALIVCLTLLNASCHQAKVDTGFDMFHARALLQNNEFERLEKFLSDDNDGYIAGTISYRDHLWATETLWSQKDVNSEWLWASISKWLTKSPNSAYANLLAAQYYIDKGLNKRGEDWAKNTSDEQFNEMDTYFELAIPYLNKGSELNPNVLFSNVKKLIMITTSRRYREPIDEFLNEVPSKVKNTEEFWSVLLQRTTPRWGGSFLKIDNLIQPVIPKYISELDETKIQLFEDTKTYDSMYIAYSSKNYESVLKLAKPSIEKNTPYSGVYELAARAAKKLKKYELCMEYAESSTTMRPHRSKVWGALGECAFALQKWEKMNSAYRHKILIHGQTRYSVFELGVSFMYLHKYDLAYAFFKRAEQIDPSYVKYTEQYTHYIETAQPDETRLAGKDVITLLDPLRYQRHP